MSSPNSENKTQEELERLQRENKSYISALDHIPDFVARLDRDLRHTYVNQKLLRASGLTHDQVIGKTHREIGVFLHVIDEVEEKIQAVFKNGQPQQFEGNAREKPSQRYLHSWITPEFNEQGEVETVLVSVRDVSQIRTNHLKTEIQRDQLQNIVQANTAELTHTIARLEQEIENRKQAEKALRENEGRLQQAQRMARLGYWDWFFDSNDLHWSPEVYIIFGQNKDSFTPTVENVEACIHPEDLSDFITERETALKERRDMNIEQRIILPDGRVRHVHEQAELIFDEKDQLIKVAGIVQDITRSVEYQSTIQQQEEQLRHVIQSMPVMLDAFDCHSNLVVWNRECERVTGYKAEEAVKPNFLEKLYPDPEYRQQVTNELEEGNLYFRNKEFTLTCANGEQKTISWSNISQKYAVPGWFTWAVGVDVSERIRVEKKLRASLAEKEVLLREIHHRVKNNLQVISSLLELQSEHICDERDREYFNNSVERVRTMALVHEQLYQTGNLAQIDFDAYISNLTNYLFQAYQTNFNIKFHTDIEALAFNIEQAIPLGLMINEMVTNALKYAFPDQRPGTISIIGKQIDGNIELTVSDDGIGFSEDFNFEQSNTLGLMLIKLLASQLQAKLTIDSSSGTTYRLVIDSL